MRAGTRRGLAAIGGEIGGKSHPFAERFEHRDVDGGTFAGALPARYDDLLRIRTRVSQSRRRSIRFAYEILRHDGGEVLATGETLHIICNRQGRPKSLPEKYRQLFPVKIGSTN